MQGLQQLKQLLDRMLGGFDETFGKDAPRSILMPVSLHQLLADAGALTAQGPRRSAVLASGWYRGAPIDAITHGHDWLIAVIATRRGPSGASALYGDVRSGRITPTAPDLRRRSGR